MTKTILTFGDSNTYGTPPAHAPGENRRFGPETRWTCVMNDTLGDGYALIEDGLPGRTTNLGDPLKGPHMDGALGLRIALESQGPIDLLLMMLGTNDSQTHHGRTTDQIIGGLAALVAIAKSEPYQTRHNGFDVLLVAPPEILEQGTYRDTLMGAAEKSQGFASQIAALAAHWGVSFFDAGSVIASSPIDGLHFDAESHATLGKALAEKVRAL